jgi:hypothetical protein
VKFDYVLLTLCVAAFVVVFLLNPLGRAILFDGKIPDQNFYKPDPITPRTWMQLPVIQLPQGSHSAVANPNLVFPNPLYTGGEVYRTPKVGREIATTTLQILRCFKFVTDSTCVLVPIN